MPELPEVETIRMQLEKYIVDSVIKEIEVKNKKYEINTEHVLDKKIIGVRRFAKQLAIDLENNYSIMIHVKMTGQLIYRGSRLPHAAKGSAGLSPKVTGGLGGKHTHLIFHLDNGDLYYNDVRQFGWIKVVKNEELKAIVFAPEPFKDLILEYFQNLLSKSKRNIKVLLMDQSKIGGIGNIYANDALWLARISPKRASNSLTNQESKLLFESIETVLKAGLKYGGASELAFVTPDGNEGEYQNHSLAYDHTGELCLNCKKEKIAKFFLGGRGTYWCPTCQK
jgi:formamidopyrimidine-DNA glycosylase